MDHERFDIRHIGQQGEETQVIDKPEGRRLTAFDLKCKDAGAAVGEIACIQGVIRMIRQRGMIYPLHFGMPV